MERIAIEDLNPLSVTLRCADCLHFKGSKAEGFKKPCSEMGIKAYGKACTKMNPLVTRMAQSLGAMEGIMDLIEGMDDSQLRLFLFSAMKAKRIENNAHYTTSKGRTRSFKYGQCVYLNLSAPRVEYIDSYYKAVVIGYAPGDEGSSKGYLILAAHLSDVSGISVKVPITEVLNQKMFDIRFGKLAEKGQVATPDLNALRRKGYKEADRDLENYVVPTIDSVLNDQDKPAKSKKKIRKDLDIDYGSTPTNSKSSGSTRKKGGVFTYDRGDQ